MLLPKAFYFFFYAALASLLPFLVLYYDQIGLGGRQIGLLVGIPPLVMFLASPLWGGMADATQRHKGLLLTAISGSFLAVCGLSLTTAFGRLVPMVFVCAFFWAPVIPLLDNSVLALLGARKAEYGKQRLWGALGWGVAAPVVGFMVDREGLQWAFYGYLLCMLVVLGVGWKLPVRVTRMSGQFRRGLGVLLSNRTFLAFLFAAFIGGMGVLAVNQYLFLYLQRLGVSKSLMGLALTVATLSELPVLFYSDRLLIRWSPRAVLGIALLALAVRAVAYSFAGTPALVLMIQALHGPSFSLMWVAGVSYANENAPRGIGATSQGLFTGTLMGLGGGVGGFVGGWLYESVGPVVLFRWIGLSALVGLAVFLWAGGRSPQPTTGQSLPGLEKDACARE